MPACVELPPSARDILLDLFRGLVDDGALALSIIAVVGLAAIAAILMPDAALAAGAILLLGCLVALVSNVARAKRR